MPVLGPYSVDPSQVSGLTGADFAGFVTHLLDAERARAGIEGAALTATHRTNARDGGIDAELRRGVATSWIPEGNSAWQFKAGDIGPDTCANELREARAALGVLSNGGSYRLVLGKSITPDLITARREALEAVVLEKGISPWQGQIEVLNGDSLARWAEEFPALASSPLIRGINIVGQTFEEWSNSAMHRSGWMGFPARDQEILELRDVIEAGDDLGVRVEGRSGFGKTRMVMEALRGQVNEALVIYVPSEDQFEPALLSNLHRQGRSAVIVIDECDARRHDTFASMLQSGTRIRLVTIGERSETTARAPMIEVVPIQDEVLSRLLLASEPGLWQEAARVIVEMVSGDIDYGIKCAQAVVAHRSINASELVTPDDVRRFVADRLPRGALFLASCALALFSRIGFDGELASELTNVATGLSIPEADLRAAAAELSGAGLISSQGRFRSIGPRAVAVHLASRGWSEFGTRILSDLLPVLEDTQIERLFSRAAEVGDQNLTRDAVARLLADGGLVSSLAVVAEDRRGRMLSNLAILAPTTVLGKISNLLEASSDSQLQQAVAARRPLVWALQKLVWHSATFDQAADALLRLALVENENISNNSSGEWIGLFGTMLPSTAATPAARLANLRRKAVSPNVRVRALVVKAAERALSAHEWSMVSGEIQGGVVVERRGQPTTWGAVWEYQREMLDLLRSLADDSDPAVADAALQSIVNSIQGQLDQSEVRDHAAAAVASLGAVRLRGIRAKLSELTSVYGSDESVDQENSDDDARHLAAIQEFASRLPDESAEDRLWILMNERSWTKNSAVVEREILEALSALPDVNAPALLLDALRAPIPTDFTIGHILSAFPSNSTEEFLAEQVSGPNSRALIGYLLGRDEREHGELDRLVDSIQVSDEVRLGLTTQGPRTDRALARVSELLPRLSVAAGARGVFFWSRELDLEFVLSAYLNDWIERVETQEDYNAIVDLTALQLYQRAVESERFDQMVQRVVGLRVDFPAVGQQQHDWDKLARRLVGQNPLHLVDILVRLIESDSNGLFSDLREGNLFKDVLEAAGPHAWRSILDHLVAGASFRFRWRTRGWLAEATSVEVAADWVDGSVERARVLAAVAAMDSGTLSPVARYLINEFGSDDQIVSSLIGEFVSGFWTGNESERIEHQITKVTSWLRDANVTGPESAFFLRLLDSLQHRLGNVVREEQEEDW